MSGIRIISGTSVSSEAEVGVVPFNSISPETSMSPDSPEGSKSPDNSPEAPEASLGTVS